MVYTGSPDYRYSRSGIFHFTRNVPSDLKSRFYKNRVVVSLQHKSLVSSGVPYLNKLVVSLQWCEASERDQVPLDYAIHFMHPRKMYLPKPDPYEKAHRIILFLCAASLVMGVAKLFGANDYRNTKTQWMKLAKWTSSKSAFMTNSNSTPTKS